jgi:hypothetical protein
VAQHQSVRVLRRRSPVYPRLALNHDRGPQPAMVARAVPGPLLRLGLTANGPARGTVVFRWLGVFRLARLAAVVACPLPAVLPGGPALLA